MNDNQSYLDFAKALAKEAGQIMRRYFLATDTAWKTDNTPVTLADTEINRLVIERVAAVYPDHSVLGEEESALQDSRYTWVCDPVDGTMPYASGMPISAFSLALCDDGKPIVGVVYDPFMDRLYWAAQGSGAFCNGERLAVNSRTSEAESLVVAVSGFDADRAVVKFDGRIINRLLTLNFKPMALYTVALPSCLVASGQFGAVIFNFAKPEDGAAIKVIVEEAGGKVTDLFGNEQRYDQPVKGFLASNGLVHDVLLELVHQQYAEKESTPSFTLRELTLEDGEATHQLLRQLHNETYANDELGVTAELVDARFTRHTPELRRQRMQERLDDPGNMSWVAVDDSGSIIGMVAPRIEEGGVQRIGALYVHGDWHGKGVARELMQRALNWLDSSKPIELHVVSYNERAKAFYRKWGFNEVPDSESLFDNLIPEVKMIRLPSSTE